MNQERRRKSLEDNLKLFLVRVLSEENLDPSLQVVRDELKREIIETIKLGFQGDQITAAMSDGVRKTFQSREISDAMVQSVGPAIESATHSWIQPFLDQVSKNITTQRMEEDLYVLTEKMEDILSKTASKEDLSELNSQISHRLAHLEETNRQTAASLQQVIAGLQTAPAPVAPTVSLKDHVDAIAAASGTASGEGIDPDHPADNGGAGSTGAPPTKPSWFGDAFSSAGVKGILTAFGVVFLLAGIYWLATAFSGEGEGNSTPPPTIAERTETPAAQTDPASAPSEEPIETTEVETVQENAVGLPPADIERINLGLFKANYFAEELDFVELMCPANRECKYHDVWPVPSNEKPLSVKRLSGLAQLAALKLHETYECPAVPPSFRRPDGQFGKDSISAAETIFKCATENPAQALREDCQNDDVVAAINCQFSGHFESVPNKFKGKAEALKIWLIWGLGADGI